MPATAVALPPLAAVSGLQAANGAQPNVMMTHCTARLGVFGVSIASVIRRQDEFFWR